MFLAIVGGGGPVNGVTRGALAFHFHVE